MRTLPLSLLPLLALAACAPALPEVASPDVPPQCQDQVYADPAVKAAIISANNQDSQIRMPGLATQKQAIAVALRRCLSERGLAPRGGVEPIKPF